MGFGMFVHFGLYSVVGKGEWNFAMLNEKQKEEYRKLPLKFKVKKDWAQKLVKTAKSAGAKYIVLTTRHHDGFSLYDTQGLNEFDAPHSACGRDLIKEFVEACRAGNIVPFFYHTLLDWYNEDYMTNFPKYIDYLVSSLEILCKNYGKIGGFWFDGMWGKPNEDWQQDRIYAMLRKYQPQAIITNNTGLAAQGQTGHKEIDCVTFERGKPFVVKSSEGKPVAGEMCQVMNDHWGYAKEDINYKPVKEIIEDLVDCRKCGCNFLLNVGPKGNGEVREIDREILKMIGMWIRKNKEFIYGAKGSDLECEGGTVLQNGDKYYVAIKDVPMSADPNVMFNQDVKCVRLNKYIKSARWLDNGKKAEIKKNVLKVEPYFYGTSFSVRVAQIEI